jgi:hypothetical protein
VELELVRVRLHDLECDDLGPVERPAAWTIEGGELLVDLDGRPVRVVMMVPTPAWSPVAALVRVSPCSDAFALA